MGSWPKNKYYDFKKQIVLSENDGCALEEWSTNYQHFSFAHHPQGFPVFLPPDKLDVSDEYASGDPYTVAENINSDFHKVRIELTLSLVGEALQHNGTPIARILDVGCGEGHITARIKERFPLADVSGFDYSVLAICKATKDGGGIDFCVANAYVPPYCNDYFDVIVCNNIWEHVPDPLHLVFSLKRILKLGGFLIISTPSRYRIENLGRALIGRPCVLAPHHVTEYSVGQVIEQLNFSKFRVLKVVSKPIRTRSGSVKRFILYQIISHPMRLWCKLVGSRHVLESTVFYLSKMVEK